MNVDFLYTPIKELNSLFKLKDVDSFRLKSIFTTLGSEPLSAEQAQQLWTLVSQEEFTITQLDQLNEIPPTLAHLLVLFKAATVVKVDAMKSLLQTVPLVAQEIQYWEDRNNSQWSVFWYFLQLLPHNAPILYRIPWFAKMMGSKRVSFSKGGSWIEKLKEFEYSSPLQIGYRHIGIHIRHLKRMNRVQAHCLGLLAYPTYQGSFTSSMANLNEPRELNQRVQVLFDISSGEQWSSAFQDILDNMQILVTKELSNLETISGSLAEFEMIPACTLAKEPIPEFIPHAIESLKRFSNNLQVQHSRFDKHFEKHSRPPFLIRYWLQITGIAFGVVYAYRLFTLESVVNYTKDLVENGVDTVISFVREWLVRPVQDMLTTIRHKDSNLKIMGQNSLGSDLDSLERMVIDFARDCSPDVDVDQLSREIRTGDMTAVLSEYEKEIREPVKSLLKGNLIRALLIQVQKVKVDGGFALGALDKLLKSNELNFAFLAVMPTLMITYASVSWIRTKIGNRKGFGFGQKMDDIRLCLRDMERMLTQTDYDANYLTIGYLLCYLVRLRDLIQTTPLPAKHKNPFIEDIHDLEQFVLNERGRSEQGLQILNRIWRSYPFLSHYSY